MGSDWSVISHSDPNCHDGTCPTIWRHRTTGTVRLRGYLPGDRTRELDIEYAAEEWEALLGRLPQ